MANSDLSFAFELVDLAVDVSMKAFRRADLVVETKVDGSPVTEVDRRVEGALRDAAARYHPSDRVVGEGVRRRTRSGPLLVRGLVG